MYFYVMLFSVKKMLLLSLLPIYAHMVHGQTLKKYAIGKSGCAASFYCNPGKFEESTSTDSSVVYSGECTTSGITYELICVKLVQVAPDLELAEQVLEQYLDFLKTAYEISATKGYTRGHKLKGNDKVRGISDLWTDKDSNQLALKGWTNGHYIAVLIALSHGTLPTSRISGFLESISFPVK